MWTYFWDMHSGGGAKEQWEKIYIEAPIEEAKVIFYNRFGHNPERVTCTCCGEDYSIHECETLERSTAYHRNCTWEKDSYKEYGSGYIKLKDYVGHKNVKVIYAKNIKEEERKGEVPKEGYVWVGG